MSMTKLTHALPLTIVLLANTLAVASLAHAGDTPRGRSGFYDDRVIVEAEQQQHVPGRSAGPSSGGPAAGPVAQSAGSGSGASSPDPVTFLRHRKPYLPTDWTFVPATGQFVSSPLYGIPPEDQPPGEDPPAGAQPAPVDPVVVAWRAVADLDVEPINMELAPPPLSANPDSMGLVGLPVWLWTDPTATTWGPQSASASDGPVTVNLTAAVDHVSWDMGDGSTPIECDTATAFDPRLHTVDDTSPDCGHTYTRTSGNEPDQAYTVTATSDWTATWSVTGGGGSGTLNFTTSTIEQLRIGEMQAIRTR